jgi:hypothetical protein
MPPHRRQFLCQYIVDRGERQVGEGAGEIAAGVLREARGTPDVTGENRYMISMKRLISSRRTGNRIRCCLRSSGIRSVYDVLALNTYDLQRGHWQRFLRDHACFLTCCGVAGGPSIDSLEGLRAASICRNERRKSFPARR